MSAYIRYTPTALGGGSGGATLIIGAIDGIAPSANGLVINTGTLYAQSASISVPGMVNLTTQTFAGQKTFSTGLTGTLTGSASLNVLTSALGNLTDAGTDGITVMGGTGATVGSVSLSQHVADSTHNGYLSSTDWSTFNNKQPAGTYVTSLTVTSANGISGSFTAGATPALTLALGAITPSTVNGNTITTGTGTLTLSTFTLTVAATASVAGTNTGDVSLGAVGSAPSANAASISGQVLTLQPADGTNPGVVTTGAQTLAGAKTFSTAPILSSLTGSLPLQLDGSKNIVSLAIDLSGTQATGTLAAGRFPALTGDVTTSAGSLATSLVATSNATLATLSGLTTASSLVTVGTITAGTWSATTIALNKGGTGQTTKAGAFDALSPMTTGGDLIYGGASGTGTRLANGSANQYLASAGTTVAPVWTSFAAPVSTKYTATGTTTGYLFTVTSATAAAGDTYTNNGNTYTVLATISGATQLFCSQASAPAASGNLVRATGSGTNPIVFSTSTPLATHTVSTSPRTPLYIRARVIGGGGGGGATTTGTGGTGGISAFGPGLLVGNGGVGAPQGVSNLGGAGGTATLGTGIVGINVSGGYGGTSFANTTATTTMAGGAGGNGYFGGGGRGGSNSVGTAGATNSGAGGGAASDGSASGSAAGGGAGGYAEALVTAVTSTFVYCVGPGGAGGSGAGQAGSAGGSGVVMIEEFFQ